MVKKNGFSMLQKKTLFLFLRNKLLRPMTKFSP